MTLTSKPLAALVVALFFGAIFFANGLGWWQTETTKEAAIFTSGEFAGQANPADIRGSYTFGDVEKNFDLPVSLLVEAFAIEASDPAAFQVKSLEELYADSEAEIGTASVRLFVAFYKGLPIELSTDMYLPEPAAALLSDRNLSAEQAAYLEAHTVQTQPAEAQPAAVTPQPTASVPAGESIPSTSDGQVEEVEQAVKGKTTFAELLEWGLTPETIERVLSAPIPAATETKVKDYCTEKGLDFEIIRPALQAEIDQMK